MDRAARRGHRARPLRRRARRLLLRGRDPRGARAGRVSRPVPGPLDARQRVVGIVRPVREPVLRAPADPPSDDFIMRNAMDAQEVAIGWWPGDRGTGKQRSTRTRTRRRRASRAQRCRRPPLAGTPRSASTCSTGRTWPVREPARDGARLRALGVPSRLRGVRMGSGAGGYRRGRPATRELSQAGATATRAGAGSSRSPRPARRARRDARRDGRGARTATLRSATPTSRRRRLQPRASEPRRSGSACA